MNNSSTTTKGGDPFDLNRFVEAQDSVYDDVLTELRNGRKQSHWMWFIFPQIAGLGHSTTSQYYAIKSPDEARQYLQHPVLGTRLLECTELILAIDGRTALEVFGSPDDMKLKSSVTLFAQVAEPDSPFVQVLHKYFHDERDSRTLQLLRQFRS